MWESEVHSARDAFALLSKLFYRKFGSEALPLIEEVSYKLGIADGEKLKKDIPQGDFGNAMKVWLEMRKKAGSTVEGDELPDGSWSVRGHRCPLSLENTSRELCQAMMGLDKGMYEVLSGEKLNLNLAKTMAGGDTHCEGIWSIAK